MTEDFINELGGVLAEKIWEKIDNHKIMNGERVIINGYSEKVLLLAAEKLVDISEKDRSKLKKERIVFILPDGETSRYEQLERTYSFTSSCSSFCVNIRDSGETSVFFLKRNMETLLDESLGSKGSRNFSDIRGVSRQIIYKKTIEKILKKQEKEGLVDFFFQRIESLLGNDQDEDLAHDLLERSLYDENKDLKDAAFCKKLCLIPFGDDTGPSPKNNMEEFVKLREQFANGKPRNKFAASHSKYDPDLWDIFEPFMESYNFRIPGESKPNDYLRFFDKWPDEVDLPFIKMKRLLCPFNLNTNLINPADDDLFPFLPNTDISLVWGNNLRFKWDPIAGETNPKGHIFLGNAIAHKDIKLKDCSSKDLVLDKMKAGDESKTEIRLAPNQDFEISPDSNNTKKFLKIHESETQVIFLINRNIILLLPFNKDSEIGIPCDRSCKLEAYAYSGIQHKYDATKILVNGERRKTIELASGEEIVVTVKGPEDFKETNITLRGTGSDEEPSREKPVDSLIFAFCHAKQDDELSGIYPLEMSYDNLGPSIIISCIKPEEWQKNYKPKDNFLFDILQHTIKNPENLGPLAASVVHNEVKFSKTNLDSSDGATWFRDNNEIWTDEFINARKELFSKISPRGLTFHKLSENDKEISNYVLAYQTLLDKALEGKRYQLIHSKLSLLDTVLILNENNSSRLEEDKLPDETLQKNVYLGLPTHPLRLIWLLNREKFIHSLIKNSHKVFAKIAIDVIDGAGFPEKMALPDGTVFRYMNSLSDGFFSLYLKEEGLGNDESIKILRNAKELLNIKEFKESPILPGSRKISMCLQYVHRFVPYRKSLKALFQKSGASYNIFDACKSVPSPKKIINSLHDQLYNKNNLGLDITLEDSSNDQVGIAFKKEELVKDKLPINLKVRVPYDTDAPNKKYDMIFEESNTSPKYNQPLVSDKCPKTNPCSNLISPLLQRYDETKPGQPGKTIIGRMIPDDIQGNTFYKLCKDYQTLFKDPTDGQQFDHQSARGDSFQHDKEYVEQVKKYQDKTEFLLSLDHGAGLGFFDGLASGGENIIIDFDHNFQNPIASSSHFQGNQNKSNQFSHNYIISTKKTSTINSIVKDGLRTILDRNPGDDFLEQAAGRIIKALNGISGKYLREVLQHANDIKEAVACGLTNLFYEYIYRKNLKSFEGDLFTVLIPVDDHWSRIHELAEANKKCPALTNHHSDFLLITLKKDKESDSFEIWPKMVEVKYRKDGTWGEAKPQIKQTWKAVCHWLGISPLSIDEENNCCEFGFDESICLEERYFRMADFAGTLELYMKRTAVFFPGLLSESLRNNPAKILGFQNEIISQLHRLKGKYYFDVLNPKIPSLDDLRQGEELLAGDVFVWGPFSPDSKVITGHTPRINTEKFGSGETLDFLKNIL
jgi:hypothetical protein